jgi:putative chitinase
MIQALKNIQQILKDIGLYAGAIDGAIGYGTYSAVLLLKEKNGKNKQAIRSIQSILAENRVYFGSIDGDFGNGSMSGFNQLIPAPTLTDDLLRKIMKNSAPGYAAFINQQIERFHIKTKADLCAFLANNLHESGGFNNLRENMNYSAKRLLQVFPKYFKTLDSAQAIVNKGVVAIADVVYGGRMGNGENNGDGFKYRGGGSIHLTGLDNYRLCSIGICGDNTLLEKPELIAQPEYAIKSALWFWEKNNCSRFANFGDFEQVCKIVNGGKNGLDERIQLNQKAWSVLF